MPEQLRKMSEIMKEMSETLLRNPSGVPSSEAAHVAHVALLFANAAWSECVGMELLVNLLFVLRECLPAESKGRSRPHT